MGTTELILSFVLVVTLLASGLWTHGTIRRSPTPVTSRLRIVGVLLPISATMLAGSLTWHIATPDGLPPWLWVGVSAVAVLCLILVRELNRFDPAAQSESAAQRRDGRPRPSFAWRAGLILLPVAALAWFGLVSIRQDRALAEQQAREAAAVVARQWAQEFGRELTATFARIVSLQLEALKERRISLGLGQWAEGTDVAAGRERLAAWGQPTPGRPEFQFALDAEGWPIGVVRGAGTGQPAAWLLELADSERATWYAAQAALAAGQNNDANRLLNELLSGSGPEPLKANAGFLKALGEAELAPPDEAVSLLRTIRNLFDRAPSETGYPLGQLAWLRALQRQPTGAGLAQADLEAIAGFSETAVTPLLPIMLQQVSRLARLGSAEDAAKVEALRWLAETRLATAAVTANFMQQCALATNSSAACWFGAGGTEFLAVTVPEPATTNSTGSMTGRAAVIVHLLEDTLVWSAAVKCGADVSENLPRYARPVVSLGDREFLPDLFGSPAIALANSPLLAEVTGSFDIAPDRGDAPAATFKVRMVLAEPAVLYAQQRQRAWLFGGLIIAAAGTAFIGLFSAHSAFRRQLRLNEMKSNFVSSVSHELRAPIASVRLLAESLERGKVTDEPRRHDYFRLIGQECRRLSSLIENALDFSRIDQGRKQYEFEPTDLHALVTQTVKLLEPYAAERAVTLRLVQPTVGDLQPFLDGKAIQQALVNLIDNALKHSSPGSDVTVILDIPCSPTPEATAGGHATLTTDSSSRIMLSVTDHGPGIPISEHERIFEPFHRLGSELRRETTGVGIGLSIVRHIVEAHHGVVRVESAPGNGSRFVIELPMEKSSSQIPA